MANHRYFAGQIFAPGAAAAGFLRSSAAVSALRKKRPGELPGLFKSSFAQTEVPSSGRFFLDE
jgi:hypothetical protein